MAATDARPVPIKNTAFRATFCIWDADGDLVTGAAGLDSEVSKDGGAFADCTNEATEIGSSGCYYLDLTSTEMNADTVAVIVKTSTVGAKTTPLFFYPNQAGAIDVDVTAWLGTAAATPTVAGVPEVDITHWNGTAIPAVHTAGYPIVTVKDGTGTGEIDTTSVCVMVAAIAANAITASAIAADAIGASELAADAATEIGTAVWATAARTVTAATNITSTGAAVPITAGGLVSADVTAISTDTAAANNAESFFDGTGYAGTNNVIPTVTTTTTATNVTTVNGLAAGVITAAAIATGAIDADALAADAGTELADAIADEAYDGVYTLRQLIRLMAAVILGEASGGGTSTITFRDVPDTKTRVTATVNGSGDRSAVSYDAS